MELAALDIGCLIIRAARLDVHLYQGRQLSGAELAALSRRLANITIVPRSARMLKWRVRARWHHACRRAYLDSERWCDGLHCAQLADTSWYDGIAKERRARTPGAISSSNSSHFTPMPYSKLVKPTALPPGCAKLSTKPAPTGSGAVPPSMIMRPAGGFASMPRYGRADRLPGSCIGDALSSA